MEPINKKERRVSILSFLGIFLLAIVPICIGVYLFARVDNVENRHLRALVKSQQSTAEESEELLDLKPLKVASDHSQSDSQTAIHTVSQTVR